MKKLLICLCTLILCLACSAAKSSDRAAGRTKVIAVKSSFSALALAGNVEVDYTPSARVSITAQGNPKILSKLKAYVRNGTLHLETSSEGKWENFKNNTVRITMAAPAIRQFSASGNSKLDINSTSGINGNVQFGASGNAEIDVKTALSCTRLEAVAGGNSELCFEGTVKCSRIEAGSSGNSEISFSAKVSCADFSGSSSGNGDVDIQGIKCDRLQLTSSGNSDIEASGVNAGKLTAHASGNSDMEISGHADDRDISTSGLGEVKLKLK